jgi:hypothetical protein
MNAERRKGTHDHQQYRKANASAPYSIFALGLSLEHDVPLD